MSSGTALLMAGMTELPAPVSLIERLENATGPSKELDRLIAREVGWHRVEPRHGGGKRGGWIRPEDFLGTYSSGAPRLDSLHGTEIARDPDPFTSSLDAALTLVPKFWFVRTLGQDDHGNWFCHIVNGWPTSYDRSERSGPINKPAPIALCIAALKARAAQEAPHV